jgi:hypothetical protein
MAAVERLITTAEADDRDPDDPYVSVSARHEAVLADGHRVLLLDDRGWSSNQRWTALSVEDVEEMARMVVGPDEPPAGRSREDEEAGHWSHLAATLQDHRVIVGAGELRRLPHDVVLGERLLARMRRRNHPPVVE